MKKKMLITVLVEGTEEEMRNLKALTMLNVGKYVTSVQVTEVEEEKRQLQIPKCVMR